MIIKKMLMMVLQAYLRFKFRKKATFPRNVTFGRNTRIDLLNGSTKKNIIISDDCYIYGRLLSESGGNINIENNVHIGPRTLLGAVKSITVKKYAMISTDIIIMDNNNHPVNPIDRKLINSSKDNFIYKKWKYSLSDPIFIGENTWVGRNSTILKGVHIGTNTIVAANSVVTKKYGENLIVAGNPARIVKKDINNEKKLIC